MAMKLRRSSNTSSKKKESPANATEQKIKKKETDIPKPTPKKEPEAPKFIALPDNIKNLETEQSEAFSKKCMEKNECKTVVV